MKDSQLRLLGGYQHQAFKQVDDLVSLVLKVLLELEYFYALLQ